MCWRLPASRGCRPDNLVLTLRRRLLFRGVRTIICSRDLAASWCAVGLSGRYWSSIDPPFANSAQTMRANLLARATMTSIRGLRTSKFLFSGIPPDGTVLRSSASPVSLRS